MSKSKESAVENTDEALVAENEVKETETKTTSSDKKKRMGLTRFLQVEPQKRGIQAVLERKCRLEVMSQAEWERTVEEVCGRSVR